MFSRSFIALIIGMMSTISVFSQSTTINPENIQIVRDKWGVPHIFAPTDEEASYGLAWAQCEDRFLDLQQTMLSVNFKLGAYEGKDGVLRDIVAYLADVEGMVEANYDTTLSPKFKSMVSAYVQAVNKYAEMHPKEVLSKKLFPIDEKDIIQGYSLTLIFMTGVHYDLVKVFKNYIDKFEVENAPSGSNAIAVSRRNTKDDKTYLALNSHQPLKGSFAWYEAHVVSDEGWNILGGTFPGGVTMFTGTNYDLGWAHTLNYPDLSDVYKLEMNPKNKLQYKYDGEWKDLEVRKKWFKVKLGFLRIPIRRKFYWSVYGPTIKNKTGYYSVRFPAGLNCKAGEQWYRMNKAHSFEEFKKALRVHGLPGTNIVYADKEDNIFYMGNGQFPYRDKNYNWQMVLPGNTSKTFWEAGKYYPVDSLISNLNPECGFVFNTNNPPTANSCTEADYANKVCVSTFGYQVKSNNRGLRLQELLENKPLMSYEEFKTIKYDKAYRKPMYNFAAENIEIMFELDENKYPELAETIKIIKAWDRVADIDREGAPIMAMAIQYLKKRLFKEAKLPGSNTLDESYYVDALTYAQKYLKKHFGTVHVKLGEVQRHIRGDVNLPMYGAYDVLAAIEAKALKSGQIQAKSGESHIQLVRYTKDGKVEIESVVPYGASDNPESPHYTDQMEMFTKGELKYMTLDKEEIFKNAEKIYHPE